MKIFLDANVLVAIINKEYPVYSWAARVLSLPANKFIIYTSPVCIAIAFYFASKKHGATKAKTILANLSSHIKIATCNEESLQAVFANKQIIDVEDGIEYYAALQAGCTCIVTEDLDDFYFSEIDVVNSEGFFKKYLLKT